MQSSILLTACNDDPPLLQRSTSNYDITTLYEVGHVVLYTCKDGKTLNTTCLANGQWSNINGSCMSGEDNNATTQSPVMTKCLMPNFTLGHNYTSDYNSSVQYYEGMNITFTCGINRLNISTTCQSNSSWSIPKKKCPPLLSSGETYNLSLSNQCVYIQTTNWPTER